MTKSFQVAVFSDTTDENDETVNLSLAAPTGASLGAVASATLTIQDDDVEPTVQFSESNYSINENAEVATVTAILSWPSSQTVTVNYATNDGTATSGLPLPDYVAVPPGSTLTFQPGETGRTIQIPIIDNSAVSMDKNFTVTLSGPTNASLGVTSSKTVTILDDDVYPTVQFRFGGFRVRENSATALIGVTLSFPVSKDVAVNCATSDGTAVSPTDYTPESKRLQFARGETDAYFEVAIVNNTTADANKTINLSLSNPELATLGSPSNAVLTIVDDDAPPSSATPVLVTATGGQFSPDPAPINTWVTTTMSAQATRPAPTAGSTLNPPVWDWELDEVQYSDATAQGPWISGSDYSYMITSATSLDPDGQFDYSAVEVSTSFPTGAYWNVRVRARARYTDTSGAAYEGLAFADGKGAAFEVSVLIKPDGAMEYVGITDKNRNWLPGQLIDLKAAVKPVGAEVTYQWTIPQFIFKDYTMTAEKGERHVLINEDYQKSTIKFYYLETGNSTVKCAVTGGGVTKEGTASLSVKKPIVDYKATQGEVNYAALKPSFGLFPKGAAEQDGMEFKAVVKVPEGFKEGQWQYVQILIPQRKQTLQAGGVKQKLDLNGQTVLDQNVPYPVRGPNPMAGAAGPYSTGDASDRAADSPMWKIGNMPLLTRASTEKEYYEMYIMFKPPGDKSKWVSLSRIRWEWSGTAKWDATAGWSLEGKAQSSLAAQDWHFPPVWTKNWNDGKFVNE